MAIEPVWAHLKRITTKQGPPELHKEAIDRWTRAWAGLEQARIQTWIEHIVRHVPEVTLLEGGNHYPKGDRRLLNWSFGGVKPRRGLNLSIKTFGVILRKNPAWVFYKWST